MLSLATEGYGTNQLYAPIEVTSSVCKRAMKDTLALLFSESYHFVRFQNVEMKQLKAKLSSS